jgi:predicted component of type VI protein secretion system
MTEETLRELLARVHERLSSSSTIDPEERDMLATVRRDIDSALGSSAAAGSPPVAVVAKPGTPPLEILEAVAVRFEAEHPAIAQLLRQIAALLGQAGI